MKEIRTIKLVEQTEIKFIADDGKEFNTEKECRDYERTNDQNRVEKEFKRVDFKELKMPFIDWCSDDCGFYIVNLNSHRDFVAMMDYFNVVWNVFDNSIEEPTSYPYNMIVSYSWETVMEYKRDLKTELENALTQF